MNIDQNILAFSFEKRINDELFDMISWESYSMHDSKSHTVKYPHVIF